MSYLLSIMYNGRFATAFPDRYGLLKSYARENRKNATLAEQVLWNELRGNRYGCKFYRQHIIGDYIVDFLSHDCGLIIEVDGGYHSEPRQIQDDEVRESRLEALGFHIIRFSNEEVLYDTERVIDNILEYLET